MRPVKRTRPVGAAVPPDNNAQGLYQYIGSLTRPVRYCPETGLHGAKRPCLPWKGVAERSESFKIMIACGNHTTAKRWLSVSETGGVCSSTEQYKKTPQSARSGCQLPFQGRRERFAPEIPFIELSALQGERKSTDIQRTLLFVFNNSPLSFFSFLYSLFPNLKNLQKSTLLL